MIKAPEHLRIKHGPFANRSLGNNGLFQIPHYKVSGYEIRVMISDGMGWEHVSVTVAQEGKDATRCPTWEEMCYVKDLFWAKDECVIQYHPPASHYVSFHPYCLHLWKPINIQLPIPDPEFVGTKKFIKA